jgi:Leucine-rich repeat (LRR) protein
LNKSEIIDKLKSLDLSDNTIKAIPIEVFKLINLKTLILTKCSLQRTYDMSMLTKLTTLKLDKNDLESDKIGNIPQSLQKINISYNFLSAVPSSLCNAINITTLELTNNRIISLVGIGSLVSLVDLYIDDNLLVELPEEICLLLRLRKLSAKRNKLVNLRSSSSTHPNSTSEEPYQCIPTLFLTNTTVENLDLEGNVNLTKAELLSFNGMDAFLERRKNLKDKALSGGALMDYTLFGLN